ncbi:MAG TPA: ComF family protein [Abditibacteriaceae bacterium]|jgi:ComF family protein
MNRSTPAWFAGARASLASAGSILLDAVFPPRCAACRTWSEELFCAACQASLHPIEAPLCERCGIPFDPQLHTAAECAACRTNRYHAAPPYETLRSVFAFEGALRHAVHRFKYQDKTALAAPLAGLLHNFLLQSSTRERHIPAENLGAVVPVPLHAWRRYRRGYNQSELLARELARLLDVPMIDALTRVRHTTPQVELRKKQRRDNVRGAFAMREAAHRYGVEGAVLLIDDVCTTGATLGECARVLREAGFSSVYALTLARQL